MLQVYDLGIELSCGDQCEVVCFNVQRAVDGRMFRQLEILEALIDNDH